MTHATRTQPALQGASLWQRLAGLPATLAGRAARRRAYRVTLRELDALSDRDLADMGLHRGNIARVALEAALKV